MKCTCFWYTLKKDTRIHLLKMYKGFLWAKHYMNLGITVLNQTWSKTNRQQCRTIMQKMSQVSVGLSAADMVSLFLSI